MSVVDIWWPMCTTKRDMRSPKNSLSSDYHNSRSTKSISIRNDTPKISPQSNDECRKKQSIFGDVSDGFFVCSLSACYAWPFADDSFSPQLQLYRDLNYYALARFTSLWCEQIKLLHGSFFVCVFLSFRCFLFRFDKISTGSEALWRTMRSHPNESNSRKTKKYEAQKQYMITQRFTSACIGARINNRFLADALRIRQSIRFLAEDGVALRFIFKLRAFWSLSDTETTSP